MGTFSDRQFMHFFHHFSKLKHIFLLFWVWMHDDVKHRMMGLTFFFSGKVTMCLYNIPACGNE